MLAAGYDHKEIVQLLLAQQGIVINAQSNDGRTALMWAAANGQKEVVQLLLAHKELLSMHRIGMAGRLLCLLQRMVTKK